MVVLVIYRYRRYAAQDISVSSFMTIIIVYLLIGQHEKFTNEEQTQCGHAHVKKDTKLIRFKND